MQQISADGDQVRPPSPIYPPNTPQPKESARTHPYHYRGYNLCAMIVRPATP